MAKHKKTVLSPKKQKQGLSPQVIIGSIVGVVAVGMLLLYFGASNPRVSTSGLSYQQLVQQGNQLMDSKKYQEAIKFYRQALEKNPDANDVRTDLAASYHSLKQYDIAEKELGIVLQKDPNHVYGHFNLGIVYLTQGKNSKATEEFKTYLKLDPNGQLAAQAKTILAQLKSPDLGSLKLPNR